MTLGDQSQLNAAIEALNGYDYQGRALRVNASEPKESKPGGYGGDPRGGGGGGHRGAPRRGGGGGAAIAVVVAAATAVIAVAAAAVTKAAAATKVAAAATGNTTNPKQLSKAPGFLQWEPGVFLFPLAIAPDHPRSDAGENFPDDGACLGGDFIHRDVMAEHLAFIPFPDF